MRIFLVLICLLVFVTSCWEAKEVRIIHKIMQETISEVKTKYDLYVVGISQGYEQKKYNELGLTFTSYRKIGRDEGRKMLLYIVEIFLENINNNPEVQSYLFTWPFTEENIGVSIINPTIDKSTISDNEIFSINLRPKGIAFKYHIPGTEHGLRTEIETLEEARRLATES